jgi:hypothetical protein
MEIAALVAWVLTAGGGFLLLSRWIAGGGLRQQRGGATRFPAGLVFGHFALAAAGLVLWIIYLIIDSQGLAWVAVVLLVLVALLGFTMFARWLPTRRSTTTGVGAGAGGAVRHGVDAGPAQATTADPAERHLPVPVIAAHGLFAVATLVLVLLAALGIGS